MEQPATATQAACWYWTTVNTANFTSGAMLTFRTDSLLIQSEFPACPGVTPAPAVYYAEEYLYITPLPSPAPTAPPGFGITGKLVYLLAGDSNDVVKSYATPLGELTLEIHGTYTVDWGDGTAASGPYDTAGAPWPTGTITHTYDNVGTYSVDVDEAWTATWSLAGEGGTLGAVTTIGTIPAFQVRQIQAVVTG